ncbi:hypothetical protein RHS01_11160 [Rhizoctonia solani]|uniref:Uncharacterized protein n=1 Tax=Rhizoctonia solani TaxID=456999 RepID=A0A8H7I216_9AGAM|nr:hypothetical protein RHS01_11160 [Rhizoctonia solani]
MPTLPLLGAYDSLERRSGSQEAPIPRQLNGLNARAIGSITDSTSRSLIIVGITCGTLAAVVLLGIIVYLVIRNRRKSQSEIQHRRHRNSVPVSSRIRNGYTRTRGSSNSTATSGERSMGEVPQGYFKSWSSRSKNAYLSLPLMGMTSSENLAQSHSQPQGQLYDPESATGLPASSKNKSRKSTRERLRLDTSILAPSPILRNIPSPQKHMFSPRHRSSLMKSATTPPPLAKYFTQSPKPNAGGQPIRPRAELRVGDTPVDINPRSRGGASGFAGLGSGWTGPGGEPSIRDEDFGSDSGEDWDEKKPRTDSSGDDFDPENLRLDHSDGEDEGDSKVNSDGTTGQWKPPGSMEDVSTPLSEGITSQFPMSSPRTIPVELKSPTLDLQDDFTTHTDQGQSLARTATGRLTLAFGSKSTLSEKAQRSNTKSSSRSGRTTRSSPSKTHSRNASSTHLSVARSGTRVTRSSTVRTERSDWTDPPETPVSTISGHVMSALTGHVTTPLLRSMDSLRRAGSEYFRQRGNDGGAPEPPMPSLPVSGVPHPSGSSPRSVSVRKLPDVPPVPPIPQRYATEPRPLPVPEPLSSLLPAPPIPRSASLKVDLDENESAPTHPLSMGATPSGIRPLPVLPVTQ